MNTFSQNNSAKPYRLEERTVKFAKEVRQFLKNVPRNMAIIEDGKQLIRSSGSVGANYIEAQESLGRRNCLLHLKICRKEAKESAYWLSLLSVHLSEDTELFRASLLKEATELTRIFSSMLQKATNHEW